MNKFIFTLTFLFSTIFLNAQCEGPGEAQIDLAVNNISARLLNSGDMWWDGQSGKYITPSDGIEEVTAIFAGAIWIGGQDQNLNLKLAGQTYRNGDRTDYSPGPLDITGNSFVDGCLNWDRFFVINRTEVQAHNTDFNNDGTIDNPLDNIYGWPGRGNIHFSGIHGFELPLEQDLAPFFDLNQDGIYNPDHGDYPKMKGDQSIWWVFNDNSQSHTSTFSTPLQFEFQVMAYAEASNSIHLNNTTFYDYTIINKASEPLMNAYMGLWVDFDLGCITDDYLGFSEELQTMYVYNKDAIDGDQEGSCQRDVNSYGENIPMVGITQIGQPVSSFMVMSLIEIAPVSSPFSTPEYYNYLRGLWRDGTPLTFGSFGYDPTSTDTTFFSFQDDPSDPNGWSMCSEDLFLFYINAIMKTSLGTVQSGQSIKTTYAVVVVEDVPHPCPSLDLLSEAILEITNNLPTSTSEITNNTEVSFYPNPAQNFVDIESSSIINRVELFNLEGQLISAIEDNRRVLTLQLDDVNSGIYVVRITDAEGNTHSEKLVVVK